MWPKENLSYPHNTGPYYYYYYKIYYIITIRRD